MSEQGSLFDKLPDPKWGAMLVNSLSEVPRDSIFPAAMTSLTVVDAQEMLRDNMEDGLDCPCCGRIVRITSIPLGAGKAVTLVRMMVWHDQHKDKEWIHPIRDVNNWGLPSRDYGSCEYWGFVEKKGERKEDGNPDSGFWKLTPRGRAFASGLLRCPYRAFVWHEKLIAFSVEGTDVLESLGKKFVWANEIRRVW